MPTATTGPTSSASILQDKFQVTPTLSLTAGVRYDWDGGLTEKYGRIFNFDPLTPNHTHRPIAGRSQPSRTYRERIHHRWQ